MAVLTKEMVIEAQRIAFLNASERFSENPTCERWRELETEMWAWQKLKHIQEDALLKLLKPVGIGDWSLALEKSARKVED